MAAPDFTSIGSEILRHDLRQRFIGKSHVVEFAVDGEHGHHVGEVEGVGHVGGVEDEVEGEGPGFVPVFVGGGDIFLGAKGESVGFFGGGVGNGVDFGAEGGGEHDGEVAETAAGRREGRWVSGLCVLGWVDDMKRCAYTPRMATFLPGPVPKRSRGL